MEERFLRMTNDGVYINNYEKVPYKQTNLPIQHFSFIKDVLWKVAVKMSEHNGKSALQIEVLDYDINNWAVLGKQTLKEEIPFMVFLPFEYKKFNKIVACQRSGIMRSLCKDHPLGSKNPIHLSIKPPESDSMYTTEKQLERKLKQNEWINQSAKPLEPYQLPLETKEIIINQRFSDSTIQNGLIEFKRHLPQPNQEITISINNEFLKKEYDLLKAYITKRLGKKTFTVKIIIQLRSNELVSFAASSDDIDKINETFIEEIRHSHTHLVRKIVADNKEKKLYTVEEVFDKLETIPGNIFKSDINDIIRILTDEYKHRNSQQILFLAEQHCTDLEKVHLTLKPFFGFLFYIETQRHCNYIWELLDSHATYIWSFDKAQFSQSTALAKTKFFVNEIQEKGRNEFKRNYNENKVNYQSGFTFLDHKMKTNTPIVDFESWKEKLINVI
jgi:hypothetical protein